LVRQLIERGFRRVRAIDLKPLNEWFQVFPEAANAFADLGVVSGSRSPCRDASYIFNFASDMGGMGFIEAHKAECMLSVLINTHMLMAAREAAAGRYFFSSSACVYAAEKQVSAQLAPLREEDAYPAMPEDGYGWEK